MINWNTTKEENALILAVCKRYEAEANARYDFGYKRADLLMDIAGCHMNGCPLKLVELLAFPTLDFLHDVGGISRYINRENGKLTECFLPRCAMNDKEERAWKKARRKAEAELSA